MQSRKLAALFVLTAMSMALCGGAAAQEGTPDQQKAMEMYMKLMAPNENHAFLKSFAGDWNVTSTAWMQPGAPPSVSTSTSIGEIVLGGRYVMMKYAGTMFGQPFEGIQIIGYDNQQKKFASFWIDNMSTSFYLTSGTRDSTANTIDDTGLWPDPMGGSSKIHAVTRLVSPDEFTYELYMVGLDGKEFKSLENRATRKK
jgi:Protein of unknown function (DUF1579)